MVFTITDTSFGILCVVAHPIMKRKNLFYIVHPVISILIYNAFNTRCNVLIYKAYIVRTVEMSKDKFLILRDKITCYWSVVPLRMAKFISLYVTLSDTAYALWKGKHETRLIAIDKDSIYGVILALSICPPFLRSNQILTTYYTTIST